MEDLKFQFEDLKVYQKSLDYLDFVYKVVLKFPGTERFELSSQFQRAAQSICLNIGEGSGGTKSEFKQFIRIAKRSLRECVVCATISVRRKFLTPQEEHFSREQCAEMSRMLSGLLRSLN